MCQMMALLMTYDRFWGVVGCFVLQCGPGDNQIFSCSRVIIISINGNQINKYCCPLISLLDVTRNKNYVTSLFVHMLACFTSFLVSNK